MEDLVELISLWPSVESRLKMLDIITVRVHTISVVAGCSHSDKESYKNLGQSESRWQNWSCSCSNTITHYWHTETNTATTHEQNTMAEDKLGNFLGNVAINGQPGETESPRLIENIKICYSFSMGSAQATLLNKSFPVYHQPISHSTITQSDLTINISCLSMSSFKGTLSRRFWRYGERFAWYVLKHVWNQSRCNGTSERVTSRTGSYKACPNKAVTSLLCLHKRSVWNCPCLIWCCLSVLNYSEMASKLLVCAFIPARII